MFSIKDLPIAGSASPDVAARAQQVWATEAAKAGVDLSEFNPAAPLADRMGWAVRTGLLIAGILSRFSSKMQHSTDSQLQDCARFAAWHGMYIPPEFVCVDEAVSGRKVRRAGLDRMRMILAEKMVGVLLVYKVSRLFRHAYRGFQLVNEDVVEERLPSGLRSVRIRGARLLSVSSFGLLQMLVEWLTVRSATVTRHKIRAVTNADPPSLVCLRGDCREIPYSARWAFAQEVLNRHRFSLIQTRRPE